MKIPTSVYYLPRRFHVFWTALVVYLLLKTTQLLNRILRRSEQAIDKAWQNANTNAAKIILRTASARRGLWIKCCQYVAARSDALPEEYSHVLSKSLDDCPPTSSKYIQKLVNEELSKTTDGKNFMTENKSSSIHVDDLFVGFNPSSPIASASIAQVHVAVHKQTGQKMVLKVQHPGIRPMLLQDLEDLKTLLRWIAGAEPKFDMRPVLDAWIEMVPLETDFNHERANLESVRHVIENKTQPSSSSSSIIPSILQTNAYVPQPFPQLSTDKLFVMEYIDGIKISNVQKQHDNNKVNREKLITEITKSFGTQLFLCDVFSGDPHPGNFLVHHVDTGGQPVLLDFGICVPVSRELRLGFARLILAAIHNDSYSLVQALADIGVKLNRADPTASLDIIKYLFRTTGPKEESRNEQKEFMTDLEEREKDIEKNEQDTPIMDARSATPISNSSASNDQKEGKKRNVRNPVDSFPGHLVFFFRSLGMLRGLAVSLNVRHSYLDVLQPFAEHVLRSDCLKSERLTSVVYEPIFTNGEKAQHAALMLRALLPRLYAKDMFIGLQISVCVDGEPVLDVSAGRKGRDNLRPITPDTIFNSFSTTKGIVAIVFGMIQDEYHVEYDDLVLKYWPDYGQNGKETTTIRHILTHTAGLARTLPENLPMPRLRDDWMGIIKHFEQAKPSHPPGERMEYHALSFGWLVAGLIMKITGNTFQFYLERLAKLLEIEDECYCGNMPEHLLPDIPESRVAALSSHFMQDLQAGGALANVIKRTKTTNNGTTNNNNQSNIINNDSTSESENDVIIDASSINNSSNNNNSNNNNNSDNGIQSTIAATESAEINTFENAATEMQESDRRMHDLFDNIQAGSDEDSNETNKKSSTSKPTGNQPAYLLDLNFYNHPVMRAALIPSANGHFSARAIARIYGCFANNGLYKGIQVLPSSRIKAMCTMMQEFEYRGMRAWGAGLTLYDTIDLEGNRHKYTAVGHGGIGGSFAFAIPSSRISVAVTLNKLNVMSVSAALAIVIVCRAFEVAVPESYAVFAKNAFKMNEKGESGFNMKDVDENEFVQNLFTGTSSEDVMKILVG